MTNWASRAACAAGIALLGTAVLRADTLVLRDGRRIDGELVAVGEGTIEFRERRGRGGRVMRIDRSEVRAIELEPMVYGRPVEDSPAARPRGLREREVIVSGDVPFVDSGIDVRAGQEIYFESVGNVWWRKNQKDGPAGDLDSPYDPKRPMPRRPRAALIGKVGPESTDPFFIGGDRGPVRMQTAGRLFLGVNDDYFGDNHGNFRVVVFY